MATSAVNATASAVAAAAVPPHPGQRLADYFDNFFKAVTAISTLGASLTFAKVVQSPVEPLADYGFSKTSIQYFLANSWTLFIIDLGITTLASTTLANYKPQAIDYFGEVDSRERRIVLWWASLATTIILGFLCAAFFFLGLVVAALAGPAGWAAVGFVALFTCICGGIVIWQSPIGSKPPPRKTKYTTPANTPHRRRRRQDTGTTFDGYAPSYAPSEKLRYNEEIYEEEDDYAHPDSPVPRRSYYDDGMSRVSTMVRPALDALSRQTTVVKPEIAVPEYTVDLRRVRAIRASEEYGYNESDARQ
jgi:hypothetical protein